MQLTLCTILFIPISFPFSSVHPLHLSLPLSVHYVWAAEEKHLMLCTVCAWYTYKQTYYFSMHTNRLMHAHTHTHLPHIYPPKLISMSVRGVQRAQGRRWKKRTEQKGRGAERGKWKENCSPLSSVSFLSPWNMNILNRESALIFYKTGFRLENRRVRVCTVIVW